MKYPYGTTIFCDDIRDEMYGKKTYVGIYGSDYVLNSPFPVIIPQFSLAITFLEPLDFNPSPATIKVIIQKENGDDEVVLDFELPLGRRENIELNNIDPLAQYFASIVHFKISPFVISSAGYIKVRAYQDEIEYRLGSIHIRHIRDGENITLPN